VPREPGKLPEQQDDQDQGQEQTDQAQLLADNR
jgi:hypothetical protein